MKNYFKIKKILEDIHLVTEPHFLEHANLFLIEGSTRDLLVDSGFGLTNVKEFLSKKGFHPKLILTHSHFDHSGGMKDFLASEVFVTSQIFNHLQQKKFWGLEFFTPNSLNSVQSPENITVVTPNGLTPNTVDKISVGKYHFKIIPSPGHTADSVVLYDRKHKLLITGDTLYDGKLYAECIDSNKYDFIDSLQYLKTLDFKLVLTGHNRILNRAKALAVIERWTAQLKGPSRP